MLRVRARLSSYLVAGGMLTVAAGSAAAQSPDLPGIVRVSDSVEVQPASASCPDGTCPNGNSPYSISQSCPPGSAGSGHWGSGNGYRFTPPVKRPIYRSPVSYTKGFPDAWTGQQTYGQQPGYRAPTVYMPTDTTQLGYYYQTVPYWQPKPGAVPPPPIPSQWHTTVDQMQTLGHHPAGIIYGTAPTAVPYTPAPPPWDAQGLPPSPGPVPTPVKTTQIPAFEEAQPASASLERTSSSPALLPIE